MGSTDYDLRSVDDDLQKLDNCILNSLGNEEVRLMILKVIRPADEGGIYPNFSWALLPTASQCVKTACLVTN